MSTNDEQKQIRAALARQPRGPGRRISPEIRRLIGRYARRRLAAGATRMAVSAELGVGDQTIARALATMLTQELLPVRVASSPSRSLTVRAPAGLTIEGLDIEGVAALIRALS